MRFYISIVINYRITSLELWVYVISYNPIHMNVKFMILQPRSMYTYTYIDFIDILITINIQLILIAENLFPISNINGVAISKNTYLEDLFIAI